MADDQSVIDAIARAVDADPTNAALRTHLAGLLHEAGRHDEALEHATQVLAVTPDDLPALGVAAAAAEAVGDRSRADGYRRLIDALGGGTPAPVAMGIPDTADGLLEAWEASEPLSEVDIGELTAPGVRLADVGGMEDVKKRLELSFLAPMRNPEMRAQFGASMRGGLLLWGPPGCGKTFIARATAGELGASFYEVGLNDVLEMWIGSSERNLAAIFDAARRNTPCVLFFDEVDALGQKRTQLRSGGAAMRGVVNQFLAELDGASKDNEGVFVLAATNHPWDVDSALLRPGRFDRRILVLPPDPAARLAILDLHLRGKPVGRVDLDKVVKATEGWSGADLALLCEQATEDAMADSIESGKVRPISQADLARAAQQIRPSITAWMETARNFALFNNDGGAYDDLLTYLKRWKP